MVRTSLVGWKDQTSSGIFWADRLMSFLTIPYIILEVVTIGFAGASWADSTAVNRRAVVRSFIRNTILHWATAPPLLIPRFGGRTTPPSPELPISRRAGETRRRAAHGGARPSRRRRCSGRARLWGR